MGNVYVRGNQLWIWFYDQKGRRRFRSSGYAVGEEKKARALLDRVESHIDKAEPDVDAPPSGAPTFASFAATWVARRKAMGIRDWKNDASRLQNHLLPTLGGMRLDSIRPRHIRDLIFALRFPGSGSTLAPHTIRNIYGVLRALFRDAAIEDLISENPCILTKHQLGADVDKDPEWRSTAIFTRDELSMLVSDKRLAPEQRVFYALLGVAGLRHGEAAGVRWRHLDQEARPLQRLTIAASYGGSTKTQRTRHMPVHPVLAKLLADWRASGWGQMMGRELTPDDLIMPRPPKDAARRRCAHGEPEMRDKNYSRKRQIKDFAFLGLRNRRGHDLRRTLISLAREDGARADLLELCTHTPKRGRAFDLYTTMSWSSLCAEVAKLRLGGLGLGAGATDRGGDLRRLERQRSEVVGPQNDAVTALHGDCDRPLEGDVVCTDEEPLGAVSMGSMIDLAQLSAVEGARIAGFNSRRLHDQNGLQDGPAGRFLLGVADRVTRALVAIEKRRFENASRIFQHC